MELPPPPGRRMKDKQKKKKERTWAEAARLVRRVAEGGSVGLGGGGLAANPPLEGEGRGPAHRGRGRGHLPLRTGQPRKARGGERSAGMGCGAFFRLPYPPPPPTPPSPAQLNSCGGASWQAGSSPSGQRGPASPPPLFGSVWGSGAASFIHPGELGFREGSEAPPSLHGG